MTGSHQSDLASAGDAGVRTVLHWYDLTCPFCYVGQSRDAVLEANGFHLIDLPFQAHPEIPPQGVAMGPRTGPMYDRLEAEAKAAGLPLKWPSRLPNSRLALGVAEWVRVNQPPAAAAVRKSLYAAHFADGEDIGDQAVVEQRAAAAGAPRELLRQAITSGAADTLLAAAEGRGRAAGVAGTPAWLIRGRLVTGLQPPSVFAAMVPS